MPSFQTKHRNVTRAALLAACCQVGLGTAAAQTPPANPDKAATIEQVVVTAQHKPEYAKNVPLAVTSISGRSVDNLTSDGEDIRVLNSTVPSLYIESSFGRTYPRFYIRGLGNSDFTYNAQQPVSVIYDDVVMESPLLKAFPIFDTRDVEVLRGPQGTLFGRNTPAGVVKVDSVKPGDTYSGYADLDYGTYNTVNFSAGLGGAIVPQKLDFRISVQEQRRDNWVTNTNTDTLYPNTHHLEGYSDFAGRGQLLFKPTDDLDMLAEVDGRDLDGTARLFRGDALITGSNKLAPGFKVDQISTNGDNTQTETSFGSHFTVNYDMGPVRLSSISAYEHAATFSRGDIDGTAINSYDPPNNIFPDETADGVPALDQLTQELRLATTGDGRYSNQGGLFYFHEYLRVNSFDYTTLGTIDITEHQTQSTQSLGAFDSATYKITPELVAGGGLRISTEDKTYGVSCTLGCLAPEISTVKTSYTGVTYNANLSYAVTPDANVYARIATGYLGPALDGRNVEFDFGSQAPISKVQAETTTSYEVGLKSSLLQNKMSLNLTGYRWDTDKLQLAATGGVSEGTNLINVKHAIGEGAEAELDYKPIPALLISASASYNYTEIQDPSLEYPGCAAPCTMLNAYDPVTHQYRINGNPLPDAPKYVFDIKARYTYPLSDSTSVYVQTDWSYRSSVDFFIYKATEFDSQSLLLGGARIGYVDNKHGYEIAGFVRNMLDQVRATGALDFDNLTAFVNDPRILGIEARYAF